MTCPCSPHQTLLADACATANSDHLAPTQASWVLGRPTSQPVLTQLGSWLAWEEKGRATELEGSVFFSHFLLLVPPQESPVLDAISRSHQKQIKEQPQSQEPAFHEAGFSEIPTTYAHLPLWTRMVHFPSPGLGCRKDQIDPLSPCPINCQSPNSFPDPPSGSPPS